MDARSQLSRSASGRAVMIGRENGKNSWLVEQAGFYPALSLMKYINTRQSLHTCDQSALRGTIVGRETARKSPEKLVL